MNKLKTILKGSVLAAMVVLSPTYLYADDTEVFFARATADNAENKPIANVMIMLDTSGSMRFCEAEGSVSGFNAAWCNDHKNRRINILQEAMKNILEDPAEGVRIGIGRFNYNVPDPTRNRNGVGQIGGRILVPVVDVNDATRKVFYEAIDALNDAGNNANAGSNFPGAQPVGDTPTARAFSEVARYMMGLAPVFGTATNGAVSGVCLETATRNVGCRDVFDGWGPFEEIAGVCDVLDPSCRVDYGDWEKIPGVCNTADQTCMAEFGDYEPIAGTCDISDQSCRRELGPWGPETTTPCDVNETSCRFKDWTNWTTTMNSGATEANCPAISGNTINVLLQQRRQQVCTGFLFWQTCSTECQSRQRLFQSRDVTFFERGIQYLQRPEVFSKREAKYRTECDTETYCADYADIIKDGKYVSPINLANQCETNHVILFTDGAPSANDTAGNLGFLNCGSDNSYNCQVRIANYLNTDTHPGKRPVKTYNIGLYMGANRANMEKVSTDGAEGTYTADNAESLINAFSNILDLIADDSRTFSSPGVAVNQMNRLQHLDQLYYAVFEPRETSYWEGNLKRYRLKDGEIRSQSGPAMDPNTGYFSESARSFWSAETDGADVRKGGAREQLEGRRLFYSDAALDTHEMNWGDKTDPELLGLPADADEEAVAAVKERLKTMWGDPLHSEPVLVNYGGGSLNNYVFLSGNDGMLRGIDTRNGKEVFSFMPYQLLQQANRFTVNRPGLTADNRRQLYGLDSSWTAWRRPGDRSFDAPKNVFLYGGMRRGGYSYFAVDVTNVKEPDLMWQINSGDAGFERLGQTWSQPTLTQVNVLGERTPVLVFGGGYDPDGHDGRQGESRRANDNMGNAIYVVDAETGKLLWSASADGSGPRHTTVPTMTMAIPSTVAVVDRNLNGFADHFYVGDLGGQIFRVDIDQKNISDSSVYRFADLGGAGRQNNRRFFNPPAVSYVREPSGEELLYLSIGTGYRAHPLDENVNDFFYVIRDESAFLGLPPPVTRPMHLDTLVEGVAANEGLRGWQLALVGNGEKVLSAPVVFDGRIFFTSYEPGSDQEADNVCAVRMGTSYIYVVDLITGLPAPFSNDGTVPTDRRRQLQQDVPPPTPTMLTDDENVLIIVGTEVTSAESIGDTGLRRGSWYQLPADKGDVVRP